MITRRDFGKWLAGIAATIPFIPKPKERPLPPPTTGDWVPIQLYPGTLQHYQAGEPIDAGQAVYVGSDGRIYPATEVGSIRAGEKVRVIGFSARVMS